MADATNPDYFDQFAGEARGAMRRLAAARHHHGPRGEGEGPGPWSEHHGPPFGPGWRFPFGGFGGPGRGMRTRMRRGDVRAAILALLLEQPRNAYQTIQEITQRSEGVWRPSAGSVYPALQQLEDEGLVQADEASGRRDFRLTDEGKEYADGHPDELAAPWASAAGSVNADARSLFHLVAAVASAAVQVSQAGNDAQVATATRLLTDTRKGLYRILAEEPGTGDEPAEG